MTTSLLSRTVFRVLILCAGALTAFGAPASAAVADIPAQQVALLDSLGIQVAVATYIPPGYTFQDVKATPCARGAKRASGGACFMGPDYIVRYHKGDSWFAVEGTGGGLGGTSLTYKTFVKTKLFGTVPLRFGPGPDGIGLTPTAAQMRSPQNELYTDWLGSGPFYHVIGEHIAPEVMTRVVSSVEWLSNNS
jgi:hypothetical protein